MKEDLFKGRTLGLIKIPTPAVGETLWEVEVEGHVYGRTLVWAKDIDHAREKVDTGADFAFIRSDDEPQEWETMEWNESVKLFPDNCYLEFEPLDQIIYIPQHAEGEFGYPDPTHPDCEVGFVIEDKGDNVFCRYWRKDLTGLRTTINSESTPKDNLYPYKSVSDYQVLEAYDRHCKR